MGGALVIGCAPVWLHLYGRSCRRVDSGASIVVVPGCRVYPNGELSPAFRRRVERAVELVESEGFTQLVVSGGVTGGPLSEAEAGAIYARSLGVPEDHIVIEDLAVSTFENARRSYRIIGEAPIVVVTDPFHVLRCRIVFRRFFNSAQVICTNSKEVRWKAGYKEILSLCKTVYLSLRDE